MFFFRKVESLRSAPKSSCGNPKEPSERKRREIFRFFWGSGERQLPVGRQPQRDTGPPGGSRPRQQVRKAFLLGGGVLIGMEDDTSMRRVLSENLESAEYLHDNAVALLLPLKYGVDVNIHG